MQEKQAAVDKAFTYLAEYRVKERKFLRLADEECKNVNPAPKQKFGPLPRSTTARTSGCTAIAAKTSISSSRIRRS